LLPDGALKRQLLGEIADLVQLNARELTDLWSPSRSEHKPAGSYKKNSEPRPYSGSYSSQQSSSSAQRPRAGGRAQPASRADHAARLLLGHCAGWDTLSSEEHIMLCGLPAPHGPLFTWLESQLHEHGPQPWAALREGLHEHPSEALALKLMSGPELGSLDNHAETPQELRNLLNRMLVEQLKALETEAIAASTTDPSALQRYRELQARRRELEAAAQPSAT
jgi:DNA primase